MSRRSPIIEFQKNPPGEKSGGEKSGEQKRTGNLSGAVHINRSGRRLQFTHILRQAAIGTLPASRAVSVENKYRYNCLLDRRTTKRKQSCANQTSSWDKQWARNYGGLDDPNPANRRNYRPARFMPRQNPFYCALPYNDKQRTGHRPEAPRVVPWFNEAYQGPAVSTCKDRWIAIRKGNRTVYAQWEDAGPFCTDHWQYVFGNDRPKPNLNKGAGLDVSPAVRDYLGLKETDVTDWRFVEFNEVPHGPWATHGQNNTFVINDRQKGKTLVERLGTIAR